MRRLAALTCPRDTSLRFVALCVPTLKGAQSLVNDWADFVTQQINMLDKMPL